MVRVESLELLVILLLASGAYRFICKFICGP